MRVTPDQLGDYTTQQLKVIIENDPQMKQEQDNTGWSGAEIKQARFERLWKENGSAPWRW